MSVFNIWQRAGILLFAKNKISRTFLLPVILNQLGREIYECYYTGMIYVFKKVLRSLNCRVYPLGFPRQEKQEPV